jgi:glycosyltransferase involved in cell wall biosynthesis
MAASANSRRSLRDLWAMGYAVSKMPLDLFFYPSVYSYFPVLTRAQVILGIHDVIPEEYPHLVFPDRLRRTLWNVKGWLARHSARYVVTVSDHARDGILRRFGWPGERVWVVGEAPDTVFRPIKDTKLVCRTLVSIGIKPGTPYVICLGGLNPHKQIGMVLKALFELRQDQRFADVEIVLVGPAESDTFTPGAADVREMVSRLALQDAVHLTGYLPDQDVACLLSAAQVLALPSVDEGFGLPAVEAAACGIPAIATKNSPLPHLLEGGGVFIDPHCPGELKLALERVLGNREYRDKLGRIAFERVQSLTWQKAAGQFLDLLDEMEARDT